MISETTPAIPQNIPSPNRTTPKPHKTEASNPVATQNYERFSAKAVTVSYSKDGDRVSLSMASIEMEKSQQAKNANNPLDKNQIPSMDDLKLQVKAQLLDLINQTTKQNKTDFIDPYNLMYKVDEDAEAADVPEYWNSENTSKRIVDFAMSFRGLFKDMSDEEYIQQVKDAVAEGFKQAKNEIGDLPDASAKLFNVTYQKSMEQLDSYLKKDSEEDTLNSETPETPATATTETTFEPSGQAA